MADLLQDAVNTTAYSKWGILGFAGSGKSRTATEIAIGLSIMHGRRPVAYIDTESGVDFLKPLYDAAKVPLKVAKTRAFSDAVNLFGEAVRKGCCCIVLDSVTHIWLEIIESYIRAVGRKGGLAIKDWGRLKQEWRKLTDAYLNAPIHAILCGRAKWEYEMEVNEETEKKELVKAGTTMSTEKDMGYEPSILLEMERIKTQKGIENWCMVLKDRTDTMNGSRILRPTFKHFEPIIRALNIGGEHMVIDTSRSSQSMFAGEGSGGERRRLCEIEIEEIQAMLVKVGLDGQSADAKARRIALLEQTFGTSSKTAIESMQLEQLQKGRRAMERVLFAPVVIPHGEQVPPVAAPALTPAEQALPTVEVGPTDEIPDGAHVVYNPPEKKKRGRPKKIQENTQEGPIEGDREAEAVEVPQLERARRVSWHDALMSSLRKHKKTDADLQAALAECDPEHSWTADDVRALFVPADVLVNAYARLEGPGIARGGQNADAAASLV